MASLKDIIKKIEDSLKDILNDAYDALKSAVESIFGKSFSEIEDQFKDLYNKYISSNKNFLLEYCGLNLFNNSSSTTAIEYGDAVEPSDAEYYSFTTNGLTVNINYNDSDISKQRLIAKYLYNWWMPNSLLLINKAFGVNFYDGKASTNSINLSFTDEGDSFLTCNIDFDAGYPSTINLIINTNYIDISDLNKNGTFNIEEVLTTFNGKEFVDSAVNYVDKYLANNLGSLALMANIRNYDQVIETVYYNLMNVVDGVSDSVADYFDEHNIEKINLGDLGDELYNYLVTRYETKKYVEDSDDDTVYIHSGDYVNGTDQDDKYYLVDGVTNSTVLLNSGNDTLENFAISNFVKTDNGFTGIGKVGASSNDIIFNGSNGSITLSDPVGKNVWLLDNENNILAIVDFDSGLIDASGSSGEKILIGRYNVSDEIIAGSGNSSLWGGFGSSDDTLIGGDGDDVYWFGKGDGHDVINNSTYSDRVMLWDVLLDDISSIDINSEKISVGFNAGGTLEINGQGNGNIASTFTLANDNQTTWQYDHNNKSWRIV